MLVLTITLPTCLNAPIPGWIGYEVVRFETLKRLGRGGRFEIRRDTSRPISISNPELFDYLLQSIRRSFLIALDCDAPSDLDLSVRIYQFSDDHFWQWKTYCVS